MLFKKLKIKTSKELFLLILSTTLLFPSVLFNFWNLVENEKFKGFEFISESLVLGHLMRVEKMGMLTDQMRLGRYVDPNTNDYINHHRAFFDQKYSSHYKPYDSQIGLQGIAWGILDMPLRAAKLPPKYRLGIYRSITSFLFSVTISLLLIFFYKEFGLLVYLAGLSVALFSEVLVVFGKNLYWMTFLLFLPMVVSLYFHRIEEEKRKFHSRYYLFTVGFLIFVKSACGYEYISTVMATTVIPIVYFSIKNFWEVKKFFFRIYQTVYAGLIGFFSAIFLHLLQLAIAHGGVTRAFDVVWERITVRTHFYQIDTNGLEVSSLGKSGVFSVLNSYLSQTAFSLPFSISIQYLHLLLFFLSICILGNVYLYIFQNIERKFVGLTACTVLSATGTFSWHILAKGHSLNHTHLNTILWHIPFTFIGFASVFYFLNLILRTRKVRRAKRFYA